MLTVAPGTPYILPATLKSAPTGISWSSLPWRNATGAEQLAEQTNICHRATAMADAYCNQPLRATVDTEVVTGPGTWEMQLRPNGTARVLLSRCPVVSVVSARASASNAFPPQWTDLADGAVRPERRIIGTYGSSAPSASAEIGQTVLAAPGVVSWAAGRGGVDLEVTYINGWPHGSLTAAAAANASTIAVDDITGWVGAGGVIYDVGTQEPIGVQDVTPQTAGAVSGPGTLTLTAPLAHTHDQGTLVTALPGVVTQAMILLCVSQALTRGATATTVQNQPGASAKPSGGSKAMEERAYTLLHRFRRPL